MFELILCPCPWCKITPKMWLSYDENINSGKTWSWWIWCTNNDCKIQPKSKTVSVRKTSKISKEKMIEKLNILQNMWNDNNPRIASEKHLVDLDFLIEQGKKQQYNKNFNYR
jgi:hypothetical protein